jgi:hypothetical protein
MTRIICVGLPAGSFTNDVLELPPNPREPLPSGADVLIFDVGAMAQQKRSTVSQLKLDLRKALDRGTTLVLLFGPAFKQGYDASLMKWLKGTVGFDVSGHVEMEIAPTEPGLRPYFDEQLAYALFNSGTGPRQSLATGINSAGEPRGSVAEVRVVGGSQVVLLPTRSPPPEPRIDAILTGLSSLGAASEYPSYLDDLVLDNEPELRRELESLAARRLEVETALEAARQTKRILFLSEKPLEVEVVKFLADQLGIPARHAGGNDEDFWLIDTGGEEWCIGEVGSFASGSVDRQKVGRLDDHRKSAGKPDDFPALLVANTVHRRQSLAERDEPIAPNVRARAADDHVLIVRTLDLIRLKQLDLQGKPATDSLLDAVRAGGGWFEVQADLSLMVHVS